MPIYHVCMKPATILFFVRDGQICLAPKMRGFGAGKLNGYGGKVKIDEGETLAEALVRETLEESGVQINPSDCEQYASVKFYLDSEPAFHDEIFLVRHWQGEPRATEEMGRPEWFDADKIPYDRMWVSDREWLPRVLRGEKFRATINFSEDHETILESGYEPAEFEPIQEPSGEIKLR